MNRRHTLISYHECDHTYTVTIGTDMGQFTASVFCRPEDRDHETEYFGYEQAEIKACIYHARAKRKAYRERQIALQNFWKMMQGTRTYDIDAFYVKKLRAEIGEMEYMVKHWRNVEQMYETFYHNNILNHDRQMRGKKNG